MRKSRFSEEQIIRILKDRAAGLSAGDVCRERGISDTAFYKWRCRFGGMEVSDRKVKALENENRKLKRLLAESMMDVSTLKEMRGSGSVAIPLRGLGMKGVGASGRSPPHSGGGSATGVSGCGWPTRA